MATNVLKTRIKHKIDSPDKWNNLPTFKPLEGELIIYNNVAEPLLKIGDGETSVVNLPFVGGKAITNISRNGTTFIATHTDGTTSNFTQQDNNTTYDLNSSKSSTNGNVKINLTASGSSDGTDSIIIKGTGATTVTTDANGAITIDSVDNNTTYSVVTSSTDGIVPKFDTVDGTIDSELNDWVLTNNNGSIGWYKLPTNAFKNDNTTSFNITASASDDEVVILSGTNGTNKVTYSASHAKKGPNSGYTSNNTTTSISGAGSEGIIKIPQITVDSYGHVIAANDESITIKIPSVSDLGLSGAMKFLGTSATVITDGATINPIMIGSTSTDISAGNVVLYGSKEFVWTGSKWEELGNEGSYKVQQTAVSSPVTSGNTTAFIDSISQNAQGVITATKKNVQFPTLSGGSVTAADATVVGGVTVSNYTITVDKKTLTAGDNVTITGAADKITIAATDTTYSTASQSAAGLMSAADKKKLDGIASGATANVGDIIGVTAGVGIAGGATSGTATVKAKLRSETALTVDSVAATTTSGRVYPVAVDKTGYLAVNVPWTDTNTDTDTGATSVEVTGNGNAITAASYDATSRKLTLTKGATYNNYSLSTASSSTLGGVKIGSNIDISDGKISVPAADKSTAGVTIVYPAASCTTFSSDSGTCTPLAVQKAFTLFVADGTNNGTIKVTNGSNGWKDINVGGLGTAAYTNSSAYATASHTHDDRYYTEAEINTKVNAKLDKLTYEWNKQYTAGGDVGYLLIGSFPMYDTNVTIDIDATTNTTYHGTVVIATQNVSTTSIGSAKTITVYGDPTGTISDAIRVVWTSGSRNYNVYFVPATWSKNLIHIRAIGQYLDTIDESKICTFTKGTAPTTTTGLTVVNALKSNFNNYTYTLPNATSSTLGGVKVGSNITVSSGTISLTKANVTSALGYTPPTTNTVTTSVAGLMSAADKSKLDNIVLGQKHATVLTVGKYGAEYSTINAAIERAKYLLANEYAAGSRILIFIIDDNIYEEEITLLNNPGIDIAGLGAVVRSYTRNYPYGPLYTSGRGTFYGISFEAYNSNGSGSPSYGFHYDYHNDNVATPELRLINCRFICAAGTQGAGIGTGHTTDITFENCFFRSLTHSALYVHNSPWISSQSVQQVRFFNCQFEGSYTTNSSDYKYASSIKIQDYVSAIGGSQTLGLTFSGCGFVPVGSVVEDITSATVASSGITIKAKTIYVNGLVKTPGIEYFVQGNIYPNFVPFDHNDANTYQYTHITQTNQNGHTTIPKLSTYPEMSDMTIVSCYHNGNQVSSSNISILNSAQKTVTVGTGIPNATVQFGVSLLPKGFQKISE